MGRNKGVIEDHFDRQAELENTLKQRGKYEQLKLLESLLPGPGQTSFTRQQEPMGLGHAVWCVRDIVGDEPFALVLPDVLIQSNGKNCLKQMTDVYEKKGGNIIAVEEVPEEDTHEYGVVSIADGANNVWPVTGMVEKPKTGEAPSNLIITGRYSLQPEIFSILQGQETGAGGEVQITDAMRTLMSDQSFHAVKFDGKSYDCGSKQGFLMANVAYALSDPSMRDELRANLKKLLSEDL